MDKETIRSQSGKSLEDLSLQALLAGTLTTEDFRISGDTLRHQADAAEQAGYRQFADNLRRAAELTAISNDEVLAIYSALRPGRASHAELVALAERLENEHQAPLTAQLVREAAGVYRERGLTTDEN
jgi:propanediol dehydratase small subunit